MSAVPERRAVLCVGRLYCDLIFTDLPRMPSLGTEVFTGGFGLHAGGGAYITAAYIAALGRPSSLASFLPAAPFHDTVAAEIDAAGVDTGLCRQASGGLDPQVTVAMVAEGERAFLTRRSGAAIPPLSASDLVESGVRHMHIGELSTLVERPDLLQVARAAGATVSLDCGWDEAIEPEGVARLLGGVDVFLPNRAEAASLSALGLSEPFAPLTVVKCGADGARAAWPDREICEPAERVTAVDTTGAGDAFNAGFLSAWLSDKPVASCLKAGNAMGARAIAARGGVHTGGVRARAGDLVL